MARTTKRSGFKMRSGDTTPFKDMGSSPGESPMKEPISLGTALAIGAGTAAVSATAAAIAAKKKKDDARKAKAEQRAQEATESSGEAMDVTPTDTNVSGGDPGPAPSDEQSKMESVGAKVASTTEGSGMSGVASETEEKEETEKELETN